MFDSCQILAASFSVIFTSELASGRQGRWSRAQTPRPPWNRNEREKHGTGQLLYFLVREQITGTICPAGKDSKLQFHWEMLLPQSNPAEVIHLSPKKHVQSNPCPPRSRTQMPKILKDKKQRNSNSSLSYPHPSPLGQSLGGRYQQVEGLVTVGRNDTDCSSLCASVLIWGQADYFSKL